MNLEDLQNHVGGQKARQIFKILKSHLLSTEITERAGVSIYNYDITIAIEYFRDLAIDKNRTRTDKQFNSYFEMIEAFKEMKAKGVA